MMVHNSRNANRGQWINLAIASIAALIVYLCIAALLPASVDDIPIAQGLQEVAAPVHLGDTLLQMVNYILIIVVINLLVFQLGRIVGVKRNAHIALIAAISSIGGLLLATSPLAEEFVWNMIIYFHLKRGGDSQIDLTINLLRTGFAIGIGTSIGFALSVMSVVFSRQKSKFQV